MSIPANQDRKEAPVRPALASFTLEGLTNALVDAGFEQYRAMQVVYWLYKKGATSFRDMKNIPAALIEHLEANYTLVGSSLIAAHDSGDGAVRLEIALSDSLIVESVLMESHGRMTLCLSSQVGCPLGCVFCATGHGGFERNLDSAEIVEQALHAAGLMEGRSRLTNVVFMGMGEPCLNIDAVFDAVRILNAPYGFHISARKITISTLGSPRCIDAIADFPMAVGLAVSLHAADDTLRETLVPSAPASVEETVEAAWRYFKKTGREVTYEYVLISGLNDSVEHAEELALVLSGKRAYVNIIPYNEVESLPFERPSAHKAAGFQRVLNSRGIKANVRKSLGRGNKAACGQLRLTRLPGADR
jgi:23S rRNA (adenine2503-C2)-methyltransferase